MAAVSNNRRFRIHPVLWIIYQFSKALVCVSFKFFYRKTVILNKERLNLQRPYILVSNHPSTMMDPLNVAKEAKGIVFFLANAGLFESKFGNWFFSNLYCIPIKRKIDTGKRKISNADSFAKCDEFLARNGVLYIAAEGGSYPTRSLRPLKTGTARIALSAENKQNFNLDLHILPVALTYENLFLFRKDMIINVGEPIKIKDYQALEQENHQKAVKQITSDLEDQLQAMLLHTAEEDKDVQELAVDLANTQENTSITDFYKKGKAYIPSLLQMKQNNPSQFKAAQEKLTAFKQDLAQQNLNAKYLQSPNYFINLLTLILSFPLFLYGWINNVLAYYLPRLASDKLDVFPGYIPTVKVLMGVITVSIFYSLQTWLVGLFTENDWIKWIYLLTLIPTGLFAWWYMQYAKQFNWKRRFAALKQEEKNRLLELKKSLL